MIKTTLKIDGMMCGMCEAHMNDLIRKNFKVKKVTSSAKSGETVIISEDNIDTEAAKKAIKASSPSSRRIPRTPVEVRPMVRI